MRDGGIGILNVGAGDTKLTFDKAKPAERARAAKIVQEMLERGYAILVQVGKHKDGDPIFRRAKAFDPETCEYIIAGGPDEAIDVADLISPPAPGTKGDTERAARQSRKREARVPADRTRAVSVSRSAGG